MSDTLKLIQALGSKICHDLAGSIGTIDNCLGLLDSDNKTIGNQAKDLVLQESKNLVKRIKFFRSTYGLVENESRLSIIDIVDLLKNFLFSRRKLQNSRMRLGSACWPAFSNSFLGGSLMAQNCW